MTEIVLGYVPCKNKKEAEKIGKELIEKRLAACTNIVPEIFSCYKWEGKTLNEKETLLLIKTVKNRIKPVSALVKKMHSYKLPCIGFIKFEEINKEYELWVKKRSY